MNAYFRQVGRTALRTLDFRTRSSRGEFLIYLVVSQLPLVVAHWTASWFAPPPVADAIMLAAAFVISAPLFALGVRRLHDFGHSGWWSLPLLVLIGRTLILDLIGLTAGWPVRSAIEGILSYVDWLATIPSVAVFAAMAAWPGKKGTNRFGPAPQSVPTQTETADTEKSAPAV